MPGFKNKLKKKMRQHAHQGSRDEGAKVLKKYRKGQHALADVAKDSPDKRKRARKKVKAYYDRHPVSPAGSVGRFKGKNSPPQKLRKPKK